MAIYSALGMLVCIVMLVSGYKSFRKPESTFFRMSAWGSAAILGVMLFIDSVFGIVPRSLSEEEFTMTRTNAKAIAAAMNDTKEFLMRVQGIESVNFSNDNGKLRILVKVFSMSDEDIEELEHEVQREFLHNLIDEIENPNDIFDMEGFKIFVSSISK